MKVARSCSQALPSSSLVKLQRDQTGQGSCSQDAQQDLGWQMPGNTTYIRQLDVEELDAYFEMLTEAFAAKGTPREYFEQHWLMDPYRDPKDVWVAVRRGLNGSEQLVATLRLFRRTVWLADRSISAAGVGEVATHPDHRGKGLARELLEAAAAAASAQVSFLHASGGLVSYYARIGWCQLPDGKGHRALETCTNLSCVQSWASCELQQVRAVCSSEGLTCAQLDAQSTSDSELAELCALYDRAVRKENLVGCLHRDPQYWKQWVLRDATTNGLNKLRVGHSLRSRNGQLAGYLFLECAPRYSPPLINVKEFFCVEPRGSPRYGVLFRLLLVEAIHTVVEALGLGPGKPPGDPQVALRVPAAVAPCGFTFPVGAAPTDAVVERGWMWRVLDSSMTLDELFKPMLEAAAEDRLSFWRTDYF